MYDELIKALRNVSEYDSGYAKLMYDAADAIEVLSKTEKTTQWIPITERLPEKDGLYLVWMLWPCDEFPTWSIINFDSCVGEFGEWQEFCDKDTLAIVDREFSQIRNVFAWMPLPEPPKEE